jgi:hypothetical protein
LQRTLPATVIGFGCSGTPDRRRGARPRTLRIASATQMRGPQARPARRLSTTRYPRVDRVDSLRRGRRPLSPPVHGWGNGQCDGRSSTRSTSCGQFNVAANRRRDQRRAANSTSRPIVGAINVAADHRRDQHRGRSPARSTSRPITGAINIAADHRCDQRRGRSSARSTSRPIVDVINVAANRRRHQRRGRSSA